jgi:hypothetical protein
MSAKIDEVERLTIRNTGNKAQSSGRNKKFMSSSEDESDSEMKNSESIDTDDTSDLVQGLESENKSVEDETEADNFESKPEKSQWQDKLNNLDTTDEDDEEEEEDESESVREPSPKKVKVSKKVNISRSSTETSRSSRASSSRATRSSTQSSFSSKNSEKSQNDEQKTKKSQKAQKSHKLQKSSSSKASNKKSTKKAIIFESDSESDKENITANFDKLSAREKRNMRRSQSVESDAIMEVLPVEVPQSKTLATTTKTPRTRYKTIRKTSSNLSNTSSSKTTSSKTTKQAPIQILSDSSDDLSEVIIEQASEDAEIAQQIEERKNKYRQKRISSSPRISQELELKIKFLHHGVEKYTLNSTRRNGYFSILTAVLQKFEISHDSIETSSKKYKLNRFDSKNCPSICDFDDFKSLKRLKDEGLIDELFDTFQIVEVGENHGTIIDEPKVDETVAPDSIRLIIKSECPGKSEITVTLKREQSFVDLKNLLMEKDGYFKALETPIVRKVDKYNFKVASVADKAKKMRELNAAESAGHRTGARMGIPVSSNAAVNTTKKVTEGTEKYSLHFIFDGDRIEDFDTLMNDEELDLDDDFGIDVKEKVN